MIPAARSGAARLREMLRHVAANEAAGGIMLMAAAAIAIAVANSPVAADYFHLMHMEVGPTLTEKLGPMTVHLWINDGLMAIFFLLVGLEIKRELLDGALSTWRQRALPAIPALMGMAVPALMYVAITGGAGELASGWAIPTATDIAFAVGVLALLGSRAPVSLKVFLVAVAIVDDMGAVAVIAIFYTAKINFIALAAAGGILAAMIVMNRMHVVRIWPYVIGFGLLWYATLLSGVHATIAGVAAALTVPHGRAGEKDGDDHSPLLRLEHAISPWVAFLIVPVFGFANAGVALVGLGLEHLLAPLTLGIAAGLFVGKQLGVFAGVLLTVKTGLAAKPRGATWLQIYGVCMLCGIGFTMSLFIGGLAFPTQPELMDETKVGILVGSLLSAIVGSIILRLAPRARGADAIPVEETMEQAREG